MVVEAQVAGWLNAHTQHGSRFRPGFGQASLLSRAGLRGRRIAQDNAIADSGDRVIGDKKAAT
jgi:hypothetical protein